MQDLLIIGGGINGAGIARDAAGRGLTVTLCEKDDLASHTSSASTKLVHGGLRYLEHYEFRLVRESLIERETLLKMAPHIIWPMRFALPYDEGLRPAWLLRLGLFLYDHIGGRKLLPPTKRTSLAKPPHTGLLQDRLKFAFEYSDCWVEDARLVVLNAMDAEKHGAEILIRTECISLKREKDHWVAILRDSDGQTRELTAKAIVNAAGTWVDDILSTALPGRNKKNVRPVKGSHIVVKRLYGGDHCYIFQNRDNRIIFSIPYEKEYTLIGTTDVQYDGDRNNVVISEKEIQYLCNAANEYFKTPITKDQIVWTYSGIRPLYDDQSENNSTVTRDYVFDVNAPEDEAPLLSIFGGKITTYRKLAEHALERLSEYIDIRGKPWTKHVSLPGGDIPDADFDRFVLDTKAKYSWAPDALIESLARRYGTRLHQIIGQATSTEALGVYFGHEFYQAEAEYLQQFEYAKTPEDILWRRTKLGLRMSQEQQNRLSDWLSTSMAA